MTLDSWMEAAEPPGRLLVCTADDERRRNCTARLAALGFDAHAAIDVPDALKRLIGEPFDVCWIETVESEPQLREIARTLRQHGRTTRLIRLVESEPSSDAAPLAGGDEMLDASCTAARLLTVFYAAVARARLSAENMRLQRQLQGRILRDLVGTSPAAQQLRDRIQQAADCDTPTLICGEPGSGINLTARSIHDCSRRAHRPFVKVDCRVLTAELLERELFGGAHTDGWEATDAEPGLLEIADGGTLFLDNIDGVAIGFQKTLLRVLKQGHFPVPALGESRRLTVRILSSTRLDLAEQAESRSFHSDFYQYLAAERLDCPSLRERADDISLLCEHFLNRLSVQEGRPPRRIAVDAWQLLTNYNWPGNVRELHNVIVRACSLDLGSWLTADMIRPWLVNPAATEACSGPGLTLKDMERKLIEATFARHGGNRERTAQDLQIGLRTLSGKLRELGYPPRGGPGSNQATASTRAA
jgi:DNA-binding NtrC family response regulator